MKIEINNNYEVISERIVDKELDLLEELTIYLEKTFSEYKYVDKEDIYDEIYYFIGVKNSDSTFENDSDYVNYLDDSSILSITNMDELIDYFSYLLKD